MGRRPRQRRLRRRALAEVTAAPVAAAAVIALDWGSTHLRAYAFDATGAVLADRHSADGALTLTSPDAFDAALHRIAGDWLQALFADTPKVAGAPAPLTRLR